MANTTTIQVTENVKAELDALKEADESYNTVLKRLLDDGGKLWDENEIRAIARSVVDDELHKMESGSRF